MKKLLLSIVLLVMTSIVCQASNVIDEIKKIDDITAYHVPRFLIKNVLGMNGIIEEVMPGSSISALQDVESLDFIMDAQEWCQKESAQATRETCQGPRI